VVFLILACANPLKLLEDVRIAGSGFVAEDQPVGRAMGVLHDQHVVQDWGDGNNPLVGVRLPLHVGAFPE
jgi:hypothetical protein